MRRRILWLIAPLLLAAVAVLTANLWLTALGRFLIRAEEPVHAEIVVVLAGDQYGNRIVKGAELVRQGYAPKILVSGPAGMYGNTEDQLAIAFAVHRGYPGEWFIGLPNRSRSTREEADDVLAELRKRGIRSFLLVTSDYHTRRAAKIYREKVGGIAFHTVAAPDADFQAERWWRSRQGRKFWFYEWAKTISDALGV